MAKKVYLGIENPLLRPLPSGYTQIEYIQSTGTQYIDTGFYPNQDTGVTMDFEVTDTSETFWLFCGRTDANDSAYGMYAYKGGTSFYFVYGTKQTKLSGTPTQRQICVAEKNQCAINGTSVTSTAQTFTSSATMYLLARNSGGVPTAYSKAKLYSCKIYDNGTLIHDYVPCLNADGVAGLYDLVDGVFCTNAGTGSFGAGAAYHSYIARELKKIYLGDENNLARMIKKAYLGDDNGIARICYLDYTRIGTLAVGSSVFMNVNGVRTEFLIVHQGIPSADYDVSCNGTWLLKKYLEESIKVSSAHNYLNNTYLGMFDNNIQSIIKQVEIPCDASNLSAKLFSLSYTEVGFSGDPYVPVEGAVLTYFNGGANSARQAQYMDSDGDTDEWLLRSPHTERDAYICTVSHAGTAYNTYTTYERLIRPAMILPSDAQIDENFNVVA